MAKPESADLDRAREQHNSALTALAVLDKQHEHSNASTLKRMSNSRDVLSGQAEDIMKTVNDLADRRKDITGRIVALQDEQSAVAPLGDFDPAIIGELRSKGIFVKLYYLPAKKLFTHPDSVNVFVIKQDASGQWIAAIGMEDFELDAVRIAMPTRSLGAVIADLAACNSTLHAVEAQITALIGCRKLIANHVSELDERVRFLETREGMGEDERIAYLQGFCPFDVVDSLRKSAYKQGWGLVVEDPADTDMVPTLVKTPAWVRPIESLFALIKITPGYKEADVSSSFLLFMSLFFAMIVGDAGYGLVFLALTGFLRFKNRKAPPEPFRLMTIFSVTTIIWGILCGAYFGITQIPAPLARFRIDWLSNNLNVMYLCLFVGAIHLSVAHIWNMLRCLNSTLAIAQAGWTTVTWTMFFVARKMILNIPIPGWYVPIAIIGFATVIIFMTPWNKLKSEWINHMMLPLTLMSNFGDILSYLRLFALSVAGLQLAGAFNSMAKSLGFNSVVTGLLAATILFMGHTLNIMLSAISVLVHGLRLNALEFSMHFGLEWAGVPYEPFARSRTEKEDTEEKEMR